MFGGFLGSKDLWLKTDLWDTKVSGLGAFKRRGSGLYIY